MEQLPDETVGEIFGHLKSNDLYLASLVDKRSQKVSTKFIKKFKTVKQYNRACVDGDVLSVIHSHFKPKTLRYVCRGGNHLLVKYFLRKGVEDYNDGLWGAAEGNQIDLIPIMMEPGKTDWYAVILGTCRSGNRQLLEMALNFCNFPSIDGSSELYTAGKYGHEEIFKRLLPFTRTDTSFLLDGLCRGGHLELAKKYFPQGEEHYGLEAAKRGGHQHVIEWLNSLGVI